MNDRKRIEYLDYLYDGFEKGLLSSEAYKYAMENIDYLWLDEDYRYLEWLCEENGLDEQFEINNDDVADEEPVDELDADDYDYFKHIG